MLSRNEFESAVKHALRNCQRTDQLRDNPLLQARILARRAGAGPPAAELPALLAETSGQLFAGVRDQKYHRVLELTYFNPAPKQEAAADRLNLPFSTYRRHLTISLNRLTEWLWQQEREAEQARTEAADSGAAAGGAARRLSVVVLPFLNLSRDPGSDYLAAAIADSLITDLSRAIPGSFVVSRSTAFTYRNRQLPARQVGRELGVRYVLEGSVLADERHVRVNVQLTDAEASEPMWAERFDKERSDLLQVQDEIVARLCRGVGIEMIRQEAVRGGSGGRQGPDALDLVMHGKALAIDIRHPGNADQAIVQFRKALALDPENVDALAGIAATRIFQIVNRYRVDAREQLLQEAEGLISRAMALAPDHIGVLKAHCVLLRARGRFAEAIAATHAVIQRNPGEPTAYREIGLNKLYLGEAEEAAAWFRRADRIAPQDPVRWTWLQGLARALIHLGRYGEAVEATRLTIAHNPGNVRFRALLAAAEALAGNEQEAKRHLAEYLAIEPGMTMDRFVEQQSALPLHLCSRAYLHQSKRILEGLRLAGMPDG